MYLIYVDESGDIGLNRSPTSYFCLSGLAIHESQWRNLQDSLVSFRKTMKTVYGLPIRTEIHASEYIRSPPIPAMQKHVRLSILRNKIDELAKISYLSITNVVIQKTGKPPGYDVFENAWRAMFQRFENTMKYGNLPGGYRNDYGMAIVDNTDGEKLTRLVRRMGAHNPIPNMAWAGPGSRNIPIVRLIEDPHQKNSAESYMTQAADVCAFFRRLCTLRTT